GMLQLGYSEPVVPPEMMPVNQNHMPQMQGGGTIPLSLLVEFVVHKTYHDITVMADLLPGKSDLERKIAVVQFATKYRQLFIRLFSLVKWASSVDKVVKCGDISSFLDHQAMLFVDTADKLYMMSNQLLIQARLPNFSIPTAVDVLTNGTYTRLPTCIRDRVIPPKAILPSEKRATLKRIEQIVLFRLVSEIIPPQIKDLTVERGIVHLTVPGKFRASLTLMGDSDLLPWRLIKLTLLKTTNQPVNIAKPQSPKPLIVQSVVNLRQTVNIGGGIGVQDGAFSQFDYSKVKSGCVPIPGLCSFLARFQDPKDSRYKSDLEKDNPPSPNSALNSSQNKFGLMEVASGSWSGSQPSVLSHAALHGLCSKLANIHPMQASKCSQIEQFFGSLIVKRHLEKCVRLVDIGAGSQSIRVVQENWTPEDLQTLEKYFDSRITCSPYRYNAVASFVNMIFAPAYILRDFMQVMQLELTGRVIAPGMQTNTKWNMNICLTSPPRIPITLLGMPSILVRDKVLLFVQLTQAVPQNNAPNTIVVPLLHDRQSKSVQILPHAMNAQTQATRNLQHTATLLTRLDELRIQQPINDQNFLSVAVHYLMENLTFP
uniref:Mediator of RNA polymerase II transcription subunit 14 n=1 Tax=Ciona savignyi TaxID=51511 RepID=H2ZNS6_CIOSA